MLIPGVPFPRLLLLYFGITELSWPCTMTTVIFSFWFVQARVFSKRVVSSLVRGQEELSKLAEDGEWEEFLPPSPTAEAVCEREGKHKEQQWRGSSWYASPFPETAEERMEVCKKSWRDPQLWPTLIPPGQVPAGVCSSHHEIPSSLVMCNAQGQSRKNFLLWSHEEGWKDPWGSYWFGLLINEKRLPCRGWLLWLDSASGSLRLTHYTALWPGGSLHRFKDFSLIT